MMNNFEKLFSPGQIGSMTIKNRIVQGATEFEASGFNGEMSDDYINFYEKTAKGGVGLIITGYASIDDEFSQSFAGCQLKLTDRKHVAGMSKLAQKVHKYGAKVVVQAYMAGRQAVPSKITGKRIVAPSPVGFSWHDQIPEEITKEEIHEAVKKFGRAALILSDAEIDGIEVLAAGGYLINEFLSPSSNKRTDEYGGSFENRTRFLSEVYHEIRKQCPKNFTVGVRFSADEFLDDGYGLDEGVRFAKYFEELGFDYININNSNQEKRYYIIEPVNFRFGWKNYIIKAVKDAVTIPVLSTNVIKKPEQAEEMLEAGIADFAVMSRAFMADQDWAKKAREGRSEEIKNCIGCLHCLDQTAKNKRVTCAVNAEFLRYDEFPDRGNDLDGKKIIIVGAGPAGMEAAIVCEKRGADVTVFEKKGYIGGSVRIGSRTPDKDPLRWLAEYYEAMAKKLGIKVNLNMEITKDQIIKEKPYAVFVACGANPIELPFLKPDMKRVFSVERALGDEITCSGENVVVIGGGMTGCEVAEHYSLMGNHVTLLEMRDVLAPEVCPDNLVKVFENFKKADTKILMSHKVIGADDTSVIAERADTGAKVAIAADKIIVSLGGHPNNQLYKELSREIENVIPLGDTIKVGCVYGAILSGFEQAYLLD